MRFRIKNPSLLCCSEWLYLIHISNGYSRKSVKTPCQTLAEIVNLAIFLRNAVAFEDFVVVHYLKAVRAVRTCCAVEAAYRMALDGLLGGDEGIFAAVIGYHLGTREYGIELRCENIFVKDDVLFLLISLKNESAMSYELSSPRFAIESKRHTRRRLQYEKAVFPKQRYGLGTVAPSSEGRFVFTFDKISLLHGQVLRVYFYEKGGGRNLVMTLNVSDVNKAKML